MDLGFDLVDRVLIDVMHAVYIGVTKKYLKLLFSYKSKLSQNNIDLVNNNLYKIRRCLPREISRKCRSLDDVSRWKATELRMFIVHYYLSVFSNLQNFSTQIYDNFLSLHIAIRLLCSKETCTSSRYLSYVEKYYVIL